MTVLVKVMLKSGVLDPQGKAIADALHRLGYTSVADVRAGQALPHRGRHGRPAARDRGRDRRWRRSSSRTPSSRTSRSRSRRPRPPEAPVSAPSASETPRPASRSSSSRAATATRTPRSRRRTILDADVKMVRYDERALGDPDLVILPGGFSYGDYLRSGAMARFSPVMESVAAFAAQGGAVLGICNGFQILCEAGLLPGAMLRNAGLRFVCRDVFLRVESKRTPFTLAINKGDVLRMPIAHGDGNWTAEPAVFAEMKARDQVVFRYVSADGDAGRRREPERLPRRRRGDLQRAGQRRGPHAAPRARVGRAPRRHGRRAALQVVRDDAPRDAGAVGAASARLHPRDALLDLLRASRRGSPRVYVAPWPGRTRVKSNARSFSIERIVSGHEYQFASRNATRWPRRVDHARWSPVKRTSFQRSTAWPRVWPGVGIARRSSARATGSVPSNVRSGGSPRAAASFAWMTRAAPKRRADRRVVRDVVAVREEHRRDAAELLDPREERRGRARRVHEDVAGLAADEPAPRPERLLGRVAAEVDVRRRRSRGRTSTPRASPRLGRACRSTRSGTRRAPASARASSSGVSGWRATKEWPSPCAKTAGCICRHVAQSMQVEST